MVMMTIGYDLGYRVNKFKNGNLSTELILT